jgi:TetR/AcrR family transcriptional regulator, mexJK operon transcriptional repressor
VELQASATADSGRSDRSDRRRQAIIRAATEVFLRHGYVGATTDEVAARASVSKQTLYKHFADKQRLFAEVILDATVTLADELADSAVVTLDGARDVHDALRQFAGRFVAGLLAPDVVRLRRLVIAEADRFPDVARAWFERGFEQMLGTLGAALQRLADRGLLRRVEDPRLAAYQFAALVMYQPMNQVMFAGTDAVPDAEELDRIVDGGVRVFLAHYG